MSKSTISISGVGLFVLALLVRLPYLGDFMTIDEVKYIEAAAQFALGLYSGQFTDTYMFLQPGVIIAWGQTIILWWRYLGSNVPDLALFVSGQMADLPNLVGTMRLSHVILTSLTVAGIYWLARPLLGNWPAWLGVGLLATDPFFVAHSRIVNSDASAAGLMMLAFLAFAHLWREHRWRMAGLAGIMVGLALLSKIAALMIVPWLMLLAALGFYRDRQWRLWLLSLLVCGTLAAITFILLWPAMWVAPLKTLFTVFIETMNEGEFIEGQDTFFLGRVSHDPGWFFYPYVIAFRLTPVTIIGVLAAIVWLWQVGRLAGWQVGRLAGQQVAHKGPLARTFTRPTGRLRTAGYWRQRSNVQTFKRSNLLAAALLFYIVFVFVLANTSPKKLDRYVISVVPAFTLLAGVGLSWVISQLAGWQVGRLAGSPVPGTGANLPTFKRSNLQTFELYCLSFTLIAIQASFVVANYPYVLTYYNPLMGGYAQAARQVPVGWGEGLEQAAAWINARPDASDLLVSSWYGDMVRPYLHGASLNSFSSSGKEQLSADYVIFYINQSQRQKPNPAIFNYFVQQEPAFQADYQGTPYVWVYPAPRMQVQVSGKAKIEGRVQLLGYSWSPVAPQSIGRAANLSLFFHTLGLFPTNETLAVSFAAADGTLWGEWQPSTSVDWPTDTIIEWQGRLELPADMPIGDYELVIRLIDTNLNSEVTRFSLEKTRLNPRE